MRRRLAVTLASAAVFAAVLPSPVLAHGDSVAPSQLAGAWSVQPVLVALSAIAVALYAQAFLRLRRRSRSDHATFGRAALFLLGIAIVIVALSSPLDAIGEEYLLSGHMLQHVLASDLAPPLLLLALSGPLLYFFLPRQILRPIARSTTLRRVLSILVRPPVAFAVWAVAFGIWHVPPFYDYVLTHRWAHDLQHASFVISGVLVWFALLEPRRRATTRTATRLGLALALFAAGQILAMVLLFAWEPLYPAYAAQDERLFGLSPLTDQRLAGVVMMVEQLLTLGTVAVYMLLNAGRPSYERERAREVVDG